MTALIWLIIFLVIAIALSLAIGRRVTQQAEPEPEEELPEPLQIQPELPAEDLGRGAAAILNQARRAAVLADPDHVVPKGTSFHVVRQANRELAVVVRLHSEPTTDQVVARFPVDGGKEAWTKRNLLQYGRAGTLAELTSSGQV